MSTNPPWQGRYVTLDGMRGIAALGVALFHYNISQARHGYIAVDFFFVLSGFVLTRAYLPRWEAGLTGWEFMKQRIVRLYPLFLTGLVIATLSSLSNHWTGKGDIIRYGKIAASLPFNLLMLPSPVTNTLYPVNVPAWSLFFELVANVAMALFLFRLPRIGLLALFVGAAWWYAPVVLENEGGNLGAVWHQLDVCTVRTTFSFAAGMLIARLPQPDKRPSGLIGLACLAAIAALLMADPHWIGTAQYDLVFALALSPLLVWIGARFEPPKIIAPGAWFLGEMSYAVYAVHWALMEPLRYFKDDLHFDPVLMAIAFLGSCLALAWVSVRYVDIPMRAWLRSVLLGHSRRPSVANAPAGG